MLSKDAPCCLEELCPWRLCLKNSPCLANDEINLISDKNDLSYLDRYESFFSDGNENNLDEANCSIPVSKKTSQFHPKLKQLQ
jgi:hypothetical protein